MTERCVMKKSMRPFSVPPVLLLAGFCLLTGALALAQDQPPIQKDSVRVTLQSWDATYHNGVRRSGTPPTWLPRIKFRVNGPISSGSQLYVEFSLPTNKNWLRFDCGTCGSDGFLLMFFVVLI